MKFFPANSRDQWLLLLFPFKAYVLVAPVCFAIWELATNGHRPRDAWDAAGGAAGMGYRISFLVLVFAGLTFCLARKIDLALSAFVVAVMAVLFPVFILQGSATLAVTISVILLGMQFARERNSTPSPPQNAEAIQCPACGTIISGSEQKCPHCAWTYLTPASTENANLL